MLKKQSLTIAIALSLFLCFAVNVQSSDNQPGGWISLFDGKTLDGWVQINGTAKYVVDKGTIKGTTAEGSPNSFLCTKKHYSNFVLEFEVFVDDRLNSGVQIRSNSFPDYQNGRVHGYQVEIAASGNSGLIYDEARRGQWVDLDNCEQTDEAKNAFQKGKWNQYMVMCVGSHIYTWINGINIAHISDDMTKSGFIGLQVHAFNGDSPAWVKWRNIRIREL